MISKNFILNYIKIINTFHFGFFVFQFFLFSIYKKTVSSKLSTKIVTTSI